ncbi:SH3 domain-containing protein [Streptomyces sp. H27-D2]|uniref:SH3 domain-containing protein n=1 Tax=Streptomyces sp. H27-D2 TaxID=3046304 RepID=UPI002DBF1765|nr:SH3 domain-containing protein [Streptomyces sp. H27-D2]MEC4018603.1 SH3 domain-containing protein [Streptomyces sp. H27-D2]
MSKFLTTPGQRFRAGACASALATAAVLGSMATAVPAQADTESRGTTTSAPARPYGTVIARSGLNERQYPSTDSSVKGTLPHRAQVGLHCKVRAQNLEGNEVWYLLRDKNTWVSAKYVEATGNVRLCKDATHSAPDNNAKPSGVMG